MHKFLRTVGFSDIRKKELEALLKDIMERPDIMKVTKDSEGNEFAELSREFGKNIGIRICGTYDEDDIFQMEYYYPYMNAETITTQERIEIQKHAEKESYAAISDELNLGVTLIFYVNNVADYLAEKRIHEHCILSGAKLSGLSVEGKILFPVEVKQKNDKKTDYKYSDRTQLLAQAREGDEEAIENLTLEDMDLYSILSKRVMHEDILSIVSTYFMPYGIESDQYAILGDIVDCQKTENKMTHETIFLLKISCNDIIFDVSINQKDLIGEPQIGRRFKGNIWMQGIICLP